MVAPLNALTHTFSTAHLNANIFDFRSVRWGPNTTTYERDANIAAWNQRVNKLRTCIVVDATDGKLAALTNEYCFLINSTRQSHLRSHVFCGVAILSLAYAQVLAFEVIREWERERQRGGQRHRTILLYHRFIYGRVAIKNVHNFEQLRGERQCQINSDKSIIRHIGWISGKTLNRVLFNVVVDVVAVKIPCNLIVTEWMGHSHLNDDYLWPFFFFVVLGFFSKIYWRPPKVKKKKWRLRCGLTL